jgi:hypothetical protein
MKIPGIFKGLLFDESRKFGLGLWVMLLATVLLFKAMIDADKWMLCIGIAAGLIGGGTLADTYLGKKRAVDALPPAPPPAQ